MKKRYSVIMLLIVCIFMMLEPMNVLAINDIDSERAKNLTIYFYIQKTGVDTPISGAEVGVTKIADTKVVNGDLQFTVLSKYTDLIATNFRGISVSESVKIAGEFSKVTKEPDLKGVTAENGRCTFTVQDSGMYLIQQLSSTGVAEQYYAFEPYIILVPFASDNSEDWQYDILSEPKTVAKSRVDSDSSRVEQSEPINPPEESVTSIGIIEDVSDSSDAINPDRPHEDSVHAIGVSKDEESSDSQDSSTAQTGDIFTAFIFLALICASFLLAILLVTRRGVQDDE